MTTDRSPTRAALVYNPASGRGADELDALRAALAPHFTLDVYVTEPEQGADLCVRRALASRPDVVIAAGGDGTVSLVASALIGTDVALGIVARGTSNSIAQGLGVPTDI